MGGKGLSRGRKEKFESPQRRARVRRRKKKKGFTTSPTRKRERNPQGREKELGTRIKKGGVFEGKQVNLVQCRRKPRGGKPA